MISEEAACGTHESRETEKFAVEPLICEDNAAEVQQVQLLASISCKELCTVTQSVIVKYFPLYDL